MDIKRSGIESRIKELEKNREILMQNLRSLQTQLIATEGGIAVLKEQLATQPEKPAKKP